ncbi:hypothetical protein JW992_01375 [candidate division KSB1 bacterium]|nr:hypothetical protein [candidate division KSB1 bacterium]
MARIMNDYWTPERRNLIEWLLNEAPTLGRIYEGCLRILFSENNIPGWTRFVAHGVREIRNQLPFQVAGVTKGTRVDHSERIKEISKLWRDGSLPVDGSRPVKAHDIPQSRLIYIPHLFWDLAF